MEITAGGRDLAKYSLVPLAASRLKVQSVLSVCLSVPTCAAVL